MSSFVSGVKSLFTGPDTSAQEKEAARARDDQRVALARQEQTEQQRASTADQQAGLVGRVPRGRRLLQAATGDSGVSSLGGAS